jgi:pSer/pThr/pTyr-binding forkhead associated (FHA) protein
MSEKRRWSDTRHFRPTDAPLMPDGTAVDDSDPNIPISLRFVLEDMSSVLDVPVRNFLIVGRKDNGDDRQVDVDFAQMDGQRQGVSRYHAVIQVQQNRVHIKDYNSSNGTFLNGYALKPMFNYRLRHDDELVLGRLKMSVHFLTGK